MPISLSRLQTWANAPSSTKPQFTHEQIRKALEQSQALKGKTYEIYLQGSYANSTNIKVDSDIDVVVQLNSTFQHDLSRLNDFQKSLFHLTFPSATYYWSDFRRDVIAALTSYFGTAYIKSGNKSIKLTGDTQALSADIVPCLQYRNYNSFNLGQHDDFVEGMKFWTIQESKEIINYPKVHKDNGEDKNAEHRTDQSYKDLVRIIKNIKRQMVDNHNLDPKIAPSYFVECAVYNAPDGHFQNDYQTSIAYVLDFILRRCNPDALVSGSHQHLLFGLEPWQWNIVDANSFFQAVEAYYQNGSL